jgi:hypothetical protein
MDILKDELGSSSETCVTSTVGGKEETDIGAGRVTNLEEEVQESRTIPVIKTEPNVSVSVTHI